MSSLNSSAFVVSSVNEISIRDCDRCGDADQTDSNMAVAVGPVSDYQSEGAMMEYFGYVAKKIHEHDHEITKGKQEMDRLREENKGLKKALLEVGIDNLAVKMEIEKLKGNKLSYEELKEKLKKIAEDHPEMKPKVVELMKQNPELKKKSRGKWKIAFVILALVAGGFLVGGVVGAIALPCVAGKVIAGAVAVAAAAGGIALVLNAKKDTDGEGDGHDGGDSDGDNDVDEN